MLNAKTLSNFCPSVSSDLLFIVNFVYSSSCESTQDTVVNCQEYACLWSLNVIFHGEKLVLFFLTPTGGDEAGDTFAPMAAAVACRTLFALVTSCSRLSPRFSRLICFLSFLTFFLAFPLSLIPRSASPPLVVVPYPNVSFSSAGFISPVHSLRS